MARILVVDDEEALRHMIGRQLRRSGHEVVVAEDGLVATEMLEREAFDLVISDMKMPRLDGMALLEYAAARAADVEFIVLTGHGTLENAVEAFKTGVVFDYVLKPLEDIHELNAIVDRALERRLLRRENARLIEDLQAQHQQTLEYAEQLAELNAALRSMQEELVQSAKLASLGTLAAGMAHELNQPLAIIRALAQQLKTKGDAPESLRKDLDVFEGQTARMTRIIDHLRTFSRMGSESYGPVDVHQALENSLLFLETQLKNENVAVELRLCSDEPQVRGDANELEQVFLNLLANARDAVSSRAAASITVRSDVRDEQVVLEFRDNGPGIPEDALPRIFDPFYTTKDPGQGTGLGLSISHGIISKFQGRLFAQNDSGAVFTVVLPLIRSDSSNQLPDDRAA